MISKLGRKSGAREQVVRNLITSLVIYGEINTTLAKAKSIQPKVERILTIAKNNDLSARRRISAILYDKKAIAKIFELAVKNLEKHHGFGYTSIIKLGNRAGDASQTCLLKISDNIFNIKSSTKKTENDNQEEKR